MAQEDPMGCGVACVANRLDLSYAEALRLFDRPQDAKTIGYRCKYIVEALRRGGIDVRLRHIKHIDRVTVMNGDKPLPDGTIVVLVRSELYPYRHYLLKAAEGWVDPWVNMHDDADVTHASVGLHDELPGEPYYAIY